MASFPISIEAVASEIGAGSERNLTNLCNHGNVNMWSKYKPVVFSNHNTANELSGSSWSSGATWWRGNSNQCGLNMTLRSISRTATGVSSALTAMANNDINGGANGWWHEKPSGSYCRLFDFVGYNHSADRPVIRNSSISNIEAGSGEDYSVTLNWMRVGNWDISIANRTNLVPSDILGFRVGIAIFKWTGSSYEAIAWSTGESWYGNEVGTSSQGDGIIDSEYYRVISRLTHGNTYYEIPFLSSVDLTQPDRNQSLNANGYIAAMPYTNFVSFTAYRGSSVIGVAEPTFSNRQISDLWTITTNVTLDATGESYGGGYATGYVAVVNNTWDGSVPPSSGQYAYYADYQDVYVPNGGTVTLTDGSICPRIRLLQLDSSKQWSIVAMVNGSTTIRSLLSPSQD